MCWGQCRLSQWASFNQSCWWNMAYFWSFFFHYFCQVVGWFLRWTFPSLHFPLHPLSLLAGHLELIQVFYSQKLTLIIAERLQLHNNHPHIGTMPSKYFHIFFVLVGNYSNKLDILVHGVYELLVTNECVWDVMLLEIDKCTNYSVFMKQKHCLFSFMFYKEHLLYSELIRHWTLTLTSFKEFSLGDCPQAYDN